MRCLRAQHVPDAPSPAPSNTHYRQRNARQRNAPHVCTGLHSFCPCVQRHCGASLAPGHAPQATVAALGAVTPGRGAMQCLGTSQWKGRVCRSDTTISDHFRVGAGTVKSRMFPNSGSLGFGIAVGSVSPNDDDGLEKQAEVEYAAGLRGARVYPSRPTCGGEPPAFILFGNAVIHLPVGL